MKTEADIVFDHFGGACKVAKLFGWNKSTTYRWNYPKAKNGTEGRIPRHSKRTIKHGCELMGLDLPGISFDGID